tara:strand:+ start:1656 stop:4052 length:2397 start_codon:yes stop_codon:yes gene_type:complete
MTKLRSSPLKTALKAEQSITPRNRDIVDLHILKQQFRLSNNQDVVLDFESLLKLVQSDKQKSCIINIAVQINESLRDGKSKDSEYSMFQSFLVYMNYCDAKGIDPFSRKGYLSYCGRSGELMRLIELANKPHAFAYMYKDNEEFGIKATTAEARLVGITKMLVRAKTFQESWSRDVPRITSDKSPTKPFSENEKSKLLRRVQFLFFSICSELLANKKTTIIPENITAVLDELENGEILSLELLNNKPKTGDINMSSPFNVAMTMGYYLFCYYSNLNTTSIINVSHPIESSSVQKENRTTRYTTIRAWKGRANKQVEAFFSDINDHDTIESKDLYFQIEKTDGITFINALSELSKQYNSNYGNLKHPPLFYLLSYDGKLKPFKPNRTISVDSILSVYSDKKSLHTPYLVERFFEVIDKKAITKVKISNGKVIKEIHELRPKDVKQTAIQLAFAALRSMTDITLKNIYMPLKYSDIDEEGKVEISFSYSNGTTGSFFTESRYVTFIRRLESYSAYYNPVLKSRYHPNQRLTPFLLPLGYKWQTHQWDGPELPVKFVLRQVGIHTDDYYIGITAQKFRSSGASDNYDNENGGLSVATSLLQNNIKTLHDHYLEGDIVQNQVIASQAIEVLEEFARSESIDDAKNRVKTRRNITVLQYDEWKKQRVATNPNGLLCDGEPSGEAHKEHRSTSTRAKRIVPDEIKLKCFQYDKCIECKSAKLVNDVQSAYKLLSFVELLEESAYSLPEREQELSMRAESLLDLAQSNLSASILELAEEKLSNEGRYSLHNEDFLLSMEGANYNA